MSSFDTAAVLLGPIFLKQGSQFEGDYTLSNLIFFNEQSDQTDMIDVIFNLEVIISTSAINFFMIERKSWQVATTDTDGRLNRFLNEVFGVDEECPEESAKAAIFKVEMNDVHSNNHKYFMVYSEVTDKCSYLYAVPITDTKYMRSTYGLTGDLIYKELSNTIDKQMNNQSQRGAQKILQEERRQEKIINEIIQLDDDSISDNENDLATKLDVLNNLNMEEVEVGGLEITRVLSPAFEEHTKDDKVPSANTSLNDDWDMTKLMPKNVLPKEDTTTSQICQQEETDGSSDGDKPIQKPLKSKRERLLDHLFNEDGEDDPEFDFSVQTDWTTQYSKSCGSSRRGSEDFEGPMLTDLLNMKRSRKEVEQRGLSSKNPKFNTVSELQPRPLAISSSSAPTPKPSTPKPTEDKRYKIKKMVKDALGANFSVERYTLIYQSIKHHFQNKLEMMDQGRLRSVIQSHVAFHEYIDTLNKI
ncbi:uncharacterized protein RHIMIDRAFT_238743 [Rhizopus microsporus ATCC 52813]|uniref:Sld7 C-terminal domain-containing protein n=1 Tax=Rhizopus microsporus ATCC 52813 TaxID=1340429 RepID=A0A2G4SRD0_RHIZD|nr:uncharacterized protein RHIMIDRAFT_238743 [Rhizopus microsporus ATCC 52813]PHZ11305.1 hypothetical protein RHIMIDRAFT_238743 [Rhizopus microsporus ATCC 52813]